MGIPAVLLKRFWDELVLCVPLTVDEVLRLTIYAGPFDQEDLATHLDAVLPGLLERFARTYVGETASVYLKGVLPEDEKTRTMLRNPKAFFGAQDTDAACRMATEHLKDVVNQDSPDYVKRATISVIDLGVGNYMTASREAAFAVCEKEHPDFPAWLSVNDDRFRKPLIATERRKAEILVELIGEIRCRRTPAAAGKTSA